MMLVASPVDGQPPEPSRLKDLQQAYQAALASQTAPVLQKYREELVVLERTCAAKRDYATAAAVRDERQRAEKRLAEIAKRSPEHPGVRPYTGGPIRLAAKEATGAAGVVWNQQKDVLDGWKTRQASATWPLPFPLKTGAYDVVVEMACAPGSGGKITIQEDFHTLTRTLSPTKGWDDFTSQTLGTLRLSANAITLRLSALTIEGDGLFLLRAVQLVPTSDSNPP
jgi:hypothetical protein